MTGPPGLPAPATTLSTGLVLTAAAGLLLLAPLVFVMRRDPRALALLTVLALPFRLPVAADGRTVNLLIPLYVVVIAGAIAHLLPRLRRQGLAALIRTGPGGADRRSPTCAETPAPLPAEAPVPAERPAPAPEQTPAPAPAERPAPASAETPAAGQPPGARRQRGRWRGLLDAIATPRGLQVLLVASVLLYVAQMSYSADRVKAAENVAFFYVPFLALFLLLRDVRWTRRLLLACLGVAVALSVLFAGVGFVEYARKSLFLNPKVVAANQYDNYFRVNSLFFDPNIYGRFLALVMIALTVIVLWRARRRDVLVCAALLGWLLAGLVTSFSQSSIAALLLGLAVLAAWRWELRATVYAASALVALALAIVLVAPSSLHFGLKGSGGSASNATSGRTKLIEGGLELFAQRPLQGHGSGSFERAYEQHDLAAGAQNATSASHTIPITVAAEQGVIGLALYVALLISAFAVLFRGAGRSPPRMAIAACFAALVLHTWTYADFLEDPLTWTLLGIGVALAARGEAPGGWRAAA